jgi:hypothetical protein
VSKLDLQDGVMTNSVPGTSTAVVFIAEAQDHRGRQARRPSRQQGAISKILPVEDMLFLADGTWSTSS